MIQEKHIDTALKELFGNLKFTEEPKGLYDPLRYMMEIGGKRIRPRLCLTTYSLYQDHLDETVLGPAAALEVFHSFTLIHEHRNPFRRRDVHRELQAHCKGSGRSAPEGIGAVFEDSGRGM